MNRTFPLFLVPIIKVLYTEILYPLATELVIKTPNKYDDIALEFIDDLINMVLGSLGSSYKVENGTFK